MADIPPASYRCALCELDYDLEGEGLVSFVESVD